MALDGQKSLMDDMKPSLVNMTSSNYGPDNIDKQKKNMFEKFL